MATDHVRVRPHLRLEPEFRHVEGILQAHDPDLRLRKSVERRDGFYVLERKCRQRPAVNAGMGDYSDFHVQARDGYIHVSLVHWQWLTRPHNILHALQHEGEDLFAKGGHQVADEQDYEEALVKETRKRRRLGLLTDIAVDSHDPISRLEGTRVSNAGIAAHASA